MHVAVFQSRIMFIYMEIIYILLCCVFGLASWWLHCLYLLQAIRQVMHYSTQLAAYRYSYSGFIGIIQLGRNCLQDLFSFISCLCNYTNMGESTTCKWITQPKIIHHYNHAIVSNQGFPSISQQHFGHMQCVWCSAQWCSAVLCCVGWYHVLL